MNTPRVRPAGGRLAGSLRTLAAGSDLTLLSDLTAEECGCAPTPAESRAIRTGVSRRTLLTAGTLGAAAVLVAGPLLPAAFAATYPSWEDVQAAKANEATKAAEVQRIQGLIRSLTGEVARTRTAAEQAAGAFYTAQQEYFDASIRADTLQSQADLEAQNATDAANKAGRIAAQLYRDGGDTTSLELFFSGSAATADDLLSRLGVMDKLLERNQAVYAAALTARDAAQSLTDQAVVARDERDRLQQVAEQKMLESQQAADAAQQSGYQLDYSIGSLTTVDEIVHELRAAKKTVPEVGSEVFQLGCYAGETMRRFHGGHWHHPDESERYRMISSYMVVELPPAPGEQMAKAQILNPIGKTLNMLRDDLEGTLKVYHEMIRRSGTFASNDPQPE